MKPFFPNFQITLFVLLAITVICSATIGPGDKSKNKNKQKELKLKKGPQAESVFDRGLVEEEPAARDILVENAAYYKDTATRLFNGTVLGYVTPWNNHGYDVAKIWGKKFDVISPVWLQIKRECENLYELTGTQDIDAGWLSDVRKAGKADKKTVKIFPRLLFDKFSEKDFSKMLTYEDERQAVYDLLAKKCKEYKFDGIVLELWSQLAARVDDEILFRFVIGLANTLKQKGLKLILVIPPNREEMHDLFGQTHFETLYPHMHAFSLMTYDFSNPQRPGANAPLHWVKHSIEHIVPSSASNFELKRKKILMGLNMYGSDYTPNGGDPIIGSQFLDLVKHVKKRIAIDDHDVENFFDIKTPTGRHVVFYPTLYSINERISLAREMGVGISIWELGQGLDYFYDLF